MPVKEKLTDTIGKINEKNPYALLFMTVVAVLLLDYFLVMRLQIKVMNSLTAGITGSSAELERTRQNLARLPQFRADMQALNDKMDLISTKIHSKDELPLILEKISLIANHHHVRIEKIFPDRSAEQALLKNDQGQYFSIPVMLELQGGYHQFGKFLNQLEREEMFMRIPAFAISDNGGNPEEHGITLRINAVVFEKAEG